MNSRAILCLNAGSSSLKFAVCQIAHGTETSLARGAVEQYGRRSHVGVRIGRRTIRKSSKTVFSLSAVLHEVASELEELRLPQPDVVGHRSAHGVLTTSLQPG
jgi:acetate kinase